MKKKLGNRIRTLRTINKLNQIDLANALNITQASLSLYENGNKLPSIDVLIRISDYFKVSLDWLCDCDRNNKFITIADIILALKELNDLNGFKYNLDIKETDLATHTSYECTITLNSALHKLLDEDDNVLGHLLEFIKAWKETTDDLNNLKNKDIKENYEQMWWEKQIAHYSTIPVKTRREANEEHSHKVYERWIPHLDELKLGEK